MENNNYPQLNEKLRNLLEKIKNDELTIKSKNYFRLKMIALIGIAVLILVTSIFLFSFIIFTIRVSGHSSFLGFGLNGFTVFLLLFPWKLFLIDLIFIFAFEWLLRSFRFGYKVPVLYLSLALLGFMILCGYILDKTTPVHDQLLTQAGQHHLPRPINGFYQNIQPIPPPTGHNIYRGKILLVASSSLQVSIDSEPSASSKNLTVIIPFNTKLTDFSEGEYIFISGSEMNGYIKAIKISRAPDPRR